MQLVGGKDKHFILGHHNHNLPYCLSDGSDTCWHVSFPGNYDIEWNIIFVDIFLPLPVLLKTFEVWKRWRTTNVTAVTLTPRWLEMQCDREISIPIMSSLRIPLWRHPCLLRRQCDKLASVGTLSLLSVYPLRSFREAACAVREGVPWVDGGCCVWNEERCSLWREEGGRGKVGVESPSSITKGNVLEIKRQERDF